MKTPRTQQGFTAVELLITLFIAAAFLTAGYQLFNIVIKDGGDTRAESRASNVAYEYLRRLSPSATNPCTAQSPMTDEPLTIQGLSNVKMSVALTCPQADAPALSKIEAIISYGDRGDTVRYATYVDMSLGASPINDIVNGLVAHYPLNGNADAAVGEVDGVVVGAVPYFDRAVKRNSAYSFDAATPYQYIEIPSTFNLGTSNFTITLWVHKEIGNFSGEYIKIGQDGSGYGLGIGNSTSYQNTFSGSNLVARFESGGWKASTSAMNTGWQLISLVVNSSGTPALYINGVSRGSFAGTTITAPTGNITRIGGREGYLVTTWIDDFRVYNRALSAAELAQLYSWGPK